MSSSGLWTICQNISTGRRLILCYKKIMVRIHILAQKLSHGIMVITSDFGSENISSILVETKHKHYLMLFEIKNRKINVSLNLYFIEKYTIK